MGHRLIIIKNTWETCPSLLSPAISQCCYSMHYDYLHGRDKTNPSIQGGVVSSYLTVFGIRWPVYVKKMLGTDKGHAVIRI